MTMRVALLLAGVSAAVLAAGSAWADDQTTTPAPPAAPAAPAPSAPSALATPAMDAGLSANPNPLSVEAGPLGKIYVGGAVSALGFTQTNPIAGDHSSWGDVDNAQVFIQKTDGLVQFFVEGGLYSLPDLGAPYVKASSLNSDLFGPVPVAYVKIAPNSVFSLQVGKLPTLIGAEYAFTFQNPNIERGLLWNQENIVNRGVQANITKGPFTLSLSVNDGFYSGRYTWGSFLASWAISSSDTLTVDGGGDWFGHSTRASFATPPAFNNSQIYNLMFTHSSGPLSITPYIQWTYVPAVPSIGAAHNASTFGAAIIARYAFTPVFSAALRAEYVKQDGSGATLAAGAPNLLYGPGSRAWSLTFTPTYQFKVFYLRGEASYLKADGVIPGLAFGPLGQNTTQARILAETGVLF